MIRGLGARVRRLFGVGILGSIGLHALLAAAVWLVVGMSAPDDPRDVDARMVRLVPGEHETESPAPTARRAAPRVASVRMARMLSARPATPPSEPSPVPAPAVAPEPLAAEPAAPEPEPTPPPIASVQPDPVAGSPVATLPDPPRVEGAAPSATAEVAIEPGPEDGRAIASGQSALPPDFARVQRITAEATLAARAEAEPFVGRRAILEFLLDNIEFTTHVTRALRIARYRAWRTPEGLMVHDGCCALMRLSLVQATSGARVIYARAQYQQKLLPDIYGDAVVMIEYEMKPTEDGRDLVSAAVTSYVKVDSGVVAALVKVASAAAADKAALESRRLVRNFARVSRAIEEDPAKVFDEVRRDPGVPQAELERFRRLLGLQ
jgi:hypothetical protein